MVKQVIDGYHHLRQYTPHDYAWTPDEMHSVGQDFLPADLQTSAREAGVDGSVVVQARQTLEETRWLLQCALESPMIQGVVGWLPLTDQSLRSPVQEFGSTPELKGLLSRMSLMIFYARQGLQQRNRPNLRHRFHIRHPFGEMPSDRKMDLA